MTPAERTAQELLALITTERQLILSGQMDRLPLLAGERDQALARLTPLAHESPSERLDEIVEEIREASAMNAALLAGVREEIEQRLRQDREALRACKSYAKSGTTAAESVKS